MPEKRIQMIDNIRNLKNKEKKFGHAGDYVITYATLFGLFANLCANYIPDGPKKTTYLIIIAMILEVMYIGAISLKIASHYSIKKYVKEYENEKLIQEKEIAKEVSAPLTVASKIIATSEKDEFDKLINVSLAWHKLKKFFKILFWLALSVVLLCLAIHFINFKKVSGFLTIGIIVGYMSIIFPLLSILAFKNFWQYCLLFQKINKISIN